jgi:hypothetical protein
MLAALLFRVTYALGSSGFKTISIRIPLFIYDFPKLDLRFSWQRVSGQ